MYTSVAQSSRRVLQRCPGRTFDSLIADKIRSGEIARAQDLRDRLPIICESRPRILQRLVDGTHTSRDASEYAFEAGGDHIPYLRLSKFRRWLAGHDVQVALTAADGTVRSQIAFEIEHLQRLLDRLDSRLDSQAFAVGRAPRRRGESAATRPLAGRRWNARQA